jgi:hypothetical protein
MGVARDAAPCHTDAVPGFEHNAIVQLLRDHPALVPELLARVFGVAVPAATPTIGESVLGQLAPTELCADLVVELDGDPPLTVITEVQLDPDDDKLRSWPVYLALVRHRRGGDACVLVVTPSERVAAWASRPIRLGPGNENFRVLVLGPRQLPPIRDGAAVAADPALAVLTLMARGKHEDRFDVVYETFKAVPAVDSGNHAVYFYLLNKTLSEPMKKALKKAVADMQQRGDVPIPEAFQSLVDRGRAEGVVLGEAKFVLRALKARGISVSAEQRRRIETCTDTAQLEDWLDRAVLARTADELFE